MFQIDILQRKKNRITVGDRRDKNRVQQIFTNYDDGQ